MANSTVTRGNGDVFELHVHVVFGFDELAPVDLARCDLEGYDMVLSLIEKLYWYTDCAGHDDRLRVKTLFVLRFARKEQIFGAC